MDFYFTNVTRNELSLAKLPRHGGAVYIRNLHLLPVYGLMINFTEVIILNHWLNTDTIVAASKEDPQKTFVHFIQDGRLLLTSDPKMVAMALNQHEK